MLTLRNTPPPALSSFRPCLRLAPAAPLRQAFSIHSGAWGRSTLGGPCAQADVQAAGTQATHAGREVARVGLLTLLKALAATKLYQASALRAVAITVQAMAPLVDVARSSSKSRSPSSPGRATAGGEDDTSPSLAPTTASTATASSNAALWPDGMPARHTMAPPPAVAQPPTADSPPVAPQAVTTAAHMQAPAPPAVPHLAAAAHALFPAASNSSLASITSGYLSATSHPATTPVLAPQPAPHIFVVPDVQLAAELWAEELRHMQLRRQHLSDEVAELLAHHQHPSQHQPAVGDALGTAGDATPAGSGAATGAAGGEAEGTWCDGEGLFVDTGGPEFCTLTCQMEMAVEVKAAREAIRQQIAAASERCVWATTNGGARGPTGARHGASSAELQGARELQMAWEAAASDVTYLMVRLVVLQQLPAQPKQRPTVRHVKLQVLQHLHDRLMKLAAATSPLAPGATGSHSGGELHAEPVTSVPGPLPVPSAPFLSPSPALWQVDASRASPPSAVLQDSGRVMM